MPGIILVLLALCLIPAAYVVKSLWFLLRLLKARHAYTKLNVPGPPSAKLIFGHLDVLAGAKGPWNLANLTNKYGPLFKLQMLDSINVVLTDPATISRIVRKTGPGPYMQKPHDIYAALEVAIKPQTVNILTASDGPYWKAVRQAAAPCFSISNLRKVLPLVLQLTQRVADKMADAAAGEAAAAAGPGSSPCVVFDVADAAKRITSDVMGWMLLGEDLQGTLWRPSEYLELLQPVLRAQGAVINNPWHLQQLWKKDVRHQRSCLDQHNSLMDTKMERLMAQPPPEWTIAAHLLSAKDPATGKPLTRQQLKSEVAIFMAAGFETTSHAITWALSVLAVHQEVQQRLVDELAAAGLAVTPGATPRDFDAPDLGRLSYLSAVIKEVLRLCPPAPWGGTKIASDDAELCGYHVPKGTYVMVPLLPLSLAHHNYGDSALTFTPERWIGTDSDGNSDHGTSAAGASPDPLTFMAGPRDCIGQSLANLELQVVIATLLGRFRFLPGPRLQQELDVAKSTGQPLISAVYALAGVHVTMQPEEGELLLQVVPR